MIHPIVKYGDEVLQKQAATVTVFDSELRRLIEEMFESMYAAQGVGLAAPQIGISKRVAVIDITSGKDPKSKIVAINPEIIATEGKQTEEEGCLSLPGFRSSVKRPEKVTIRAQDAKGHEFTMRGEGLLARALCHETDHLNGRLFIAHLSALKREFILRKVRKMMKLGDW
ncbi:MAG: peptide deformylase [Acidobacteria bacterium RIFCSPLOWO2_12_FULL_54_10]|nr:MAG: peptide deformylase [Acidobacteria bacterium RIFCSPLOWO2_12_FULL_54_10]